MSTNVTLYGIHHYSNCNFVWNGVGVIPSSKKTKIIHNIITSRKIDITSFFISNLSIYVGRWWDGFQHLSTCCQVCIGSCDHIPSCQVPEVATSRGPGAGSAYLLLIAPGRAWPEAWDLPRVEEEGGMGRQVAKTCPSMPITWWRGEGAVCSQD
jgi:hypothetical protein